MIALYINDKPAIIKSFRGVNGYTFYAEDGTILYLSRQGRSQTRRRAFGGLFTLQGTIPAAHSPSR